MKTRRTGIIILLASVFVTACLVPNALARPRVSSQIEQTSSTSMAAFEEALERQKEAEKKLQDRIRELEKTQQSRLIELEEERKKLLEQIKPQQTKASQPLPELQSDTSFNWALGGATIFALALCIILLLRMNRAKPVGASWVQDESPATVMLGEPTSLSANTILPDPATVIGTGPHEIHPFVPALPDWDSVSPALDSQSLKALVAEKNVRNRDSTIELAEIMLSFGRINSAAEALADFIEKNPKEAFAPWLKLLEVYRANGQRTEFNRIAQKLNQTFNVWTVDWDNFNDTLTPAHSLETMTHIVERLQKLWGTRECQAYLQTLLRDTRDETRRGFPLATIDDILSLNDILEYYLGPYTGPTSTFDNDSLDTAPVTEIESNKSDSHAADTDEPQTGEEAKP